MRIASVALVRQTQNHILNNQYNVSLSQQRVSTGKKFSRASDDPIAANQAYTIQNTLDKLQGFSDQIVLAENKLSTTEVILNNIIDITQDISRLHKQAMSDTYSAENRKMLANEIDYKLSELLGLANTKDEKGEYLFSGFQGFQTPYTQNGNAINYQGDQGQRVLQISSGTFVPISDPGAQLFDQIKSGNGTFDTQIGPGTNTGTGSISHGEVLDSASYGEDTYTITFVTNGSSNLAYQVIGATSGQVIPALPAAIPTDAPDYVAGNNITFNGIQLDISGLPAVGDTFEVTPSQNQSVFTTVQNIVNLLNNPPSNGVENAVFQTNMTSEGESLTQAMEHLVQKFTEIGSRANAVATAKEVQFNLRDQNQYTLSNIEDIDYVQAVSELTLNMTSLQVAQQSYAMIQNLSLFNFI